MNCSTGKRSYPTKDLAQEALIGTHISYNYGKDMGPVNVYLCDICGQYHLTSMGGMNEKLAQMIEEGEIQKQKEAGWWESKLRKR